MTERARNKVFIKTILFSLLFFCLAPLPLFCADSSDIEQDAAWILAARKFEVESSRSKSAESAAFVMPKLILERISVDMTRDVGRDEKISRKTDSLLSERLNLFLQLSKEMQARDALVLKNISTLEFEMALSDEQKKIKDIQDKIDANLEKQELLFHPEKGKKRAVKELRKELESQSETITLYGNDSENLFEAGAEAEAAGVYSRLYEKAVSSAKINSLITGRLVFYGDYVSASVDLISYPGAKKIASVMEIGSLSQISSMAENLAFALMPKIANGLPVELNFDIKPLDALEKAVLTIDNIVYDSIPSRVIVNSGVHSISLESENYARETFVYNFSGRNRFFIEVNFKEKSDGSVKLVLSRFTPGDMFFDGKFVGAASKSDYVDVPLKVNGNNVFGYFEGTLKNKRHPEEEKTKMMFLQIPSSLMVDGNMLETKIKVFDISKNIDKRRKLMYLSYSALILSLPFLFYSYGRFVSYQRAWNSGYGDVSPDTYNEYRRMSLIASGITAGCAAWFVAELVAYLIAVDKTLPPRAKKVRGGTVQKMKNARQLEAVQSMMENESKALEPFMPVRPQEEQSPEDGQKEIGPQPKGGME